MGTDAAAVAADERHGVPGEPLVRAWWDGSPHGADPDRPVPWRPNRDDLRYDRRVQLVAVGIVVVLVALGGAAVRSVRGSAQVKAPAVAGQATSAAQAGLGYLTALSEADAAGALAYLELPPQSTELVTDAVLAESVRLSPISDIVVLTSGGGHDTGTVTMQYRLGPTRVIDTYSVTKSADGFWRLAESAPRLGSQKLDYGGFGYVPLDLPDGAVEAGLTLNGVAVSGGTVNLLPGSYQVGSTNTMLTSTQILRLPGLSADLLANDHGLRRVDGSYETQGSFQLAVLPVELTRSAQEAVAQAAAATAAQCLTEVQAKTSCSLWFDPYWYDRSEQGESPVHWNLEAGSLDLAETRATKVRGGDAPCSAATGVWVVWQAGGDFRVQGLMTEDTGRINVWFTYLEGYVVEIGDPDRLVVHLIWNDGITSCLTGVEI